MKNINIEQLRADYIIQQFWTNFLLWQQQLFTSFHFAFIFNFGFWKLLFISTGIILFIRYVALLRRKYTEEAVLLELIPPAYSDKNSYTTSEFFDVIHGFGKNRSLIQKLLGIRPKLSFEIVSTQKQGIRFLVRLTPQYASNFKRYILSYLSQVRVNETQEYLTDITHDNDLKVKVVEFTQSCHYAYPLKHQEALEKHDPVAYITGMMTKLDKEELVTFQLVVAPYQTREIKKIDSMIRRNEDVLGYLDRRRLPRILQPITVVLNILGAIIQLLGTQLQWVANQAVHGSSQSAYASSSYSHQQLQIQQNLKPARVVTKFEEEAIQSVKGKIDQPLFDASIRLLVKVKGNEDVVDRINGFNYSLETFAVPGYQSVVKASVLPDHIWGKYRLLAFKKRLLSLFGNTGSAILSSSEVADFYHFPFKGTSQTENMVKAHSKELPAPLSLKQGTKYDVVFGVNSYGGQTTEIGLTEEQRKTHTFLIGRTGSGKTTVMFAMAKHDIEAGRGMAFIDPHGDVSEDLVHIVPLERKDDLIYLNPFDIKHPMGINVLQLSEGLDEDELELEKEVVTEGVISLFKKVFSSEENSNAHRIEHILRNTIYTAFYIPNRTLFTINTLLTDSEFRKDVLSKVDDEDLVNFWESEFGKAGDWQIVKMTQGVTAKVGRFLRSPTAKRMLEQEKSTINFDDILNGKILICNLSQGKLGEDTTRLIGTMILTKLQQAALKRALIPQIKRKPFYLYIDEFQNFATFSFVKVVSEGRKYGLHLIVGEQSTSQQQDRRIINQILANITTMIVFRTGNYVDEELMLNQFSPYLQQGDIPNLSRFHFFIKISALESEEPFSGTTILIPFEKDEKKFQLLIETSRKNWTIEYKKKPSKLKRGKSPNVEPSKSNNDENNNRPPEMKFHKTTPARVRGKKDKN